MLVAEKIEIKWVTRNYCTAYTSQTVSEPEKQVCINGLWKSVSTVISEINNLQLASWDEQKLMMKTSSNKKILEFINKYLNRVNELIPHYYRGW